MAEMSWQTHNFQPVYDEHSGILILGTFPSVKSREMNFYYGHPQNRFWKVIAQLTGEPVPVSIEEKKAVLLSHGIAVWDVIEKCRISGSSDASIRDVKANDIGRILKEAPIRKICGNGSKACELYEKYAEPLTGRQIVRLPSTSPANASWKLDRLCEEWEKELSGLIY